MPAWVTWNRKPLPQNAFAPLPLTAVLPRGWLLDKIRGEPAETVDERLQRAYLLGDVQEMHIVENEIETLLSAGQPPDRAALRALMRYYGASADKRVPLHLLRYARDLRNRLVDGVIPFSAGEAADIGDLLYMALWLYNLTGQKVLLELCRIVKAQAPDWMSTLHVFPAIRPVMRAAAIDEDAYWRVDGRTVAASLKTPAMQALFEGGLKNETAFSIGWDKLLRYHGAAHGLYNADPLLAGANPSRFVEAEIVKEMMRTLPLVLWARGELLAADLLERIAHTALPAAKGRQAANQIVALDSTPAAGFSDFCAALWMAVNDGGLAAICYAPCEVRWRADGQPVRIEVETAYPFEETVTMRIRIKEPTRFAIHLRIPAWAQAAQVVVSDEAPVTCEPGFFKIHREWTDGAIVTLTLPMQLRLVRRYHQSISVERGPLTFALPVERDTPWQQALVVERGFQVCYEAGLPVVYAYAAPVERQWGMSGKMPAPPVVAPEVSRKAIHKVRLVPYGETAARIAQFPAAVVRADDEEK